MLVIDPYHNDNRRGGVLLRPWNFALPQAGTGGAGPRPY